MVNRVINKSMHSRGGKFYHRCYQAWRYATGERMQNLKKISKINFLVLTTDTNEEEFNDQEELKIFNIRLKIPEPVNVTVQVNDLHLVM